jgi:putative glycerol-1-phosphate prenyltransferase
MQNGFYAEWRHVFKLDPEKTIDNETLDAVCLSGTDALLIGGSSGVTYDNTVELLSRIRRYEVPCALEVSAAEAAVPGFDHYLIPMVLNTSRGEWIAGRQAAALVEYGAFIPWEQTAGEAYIILNGEAEAAIITGAAADIGCAQAVAYARLADRLMRVPIIYLEYSGRFGDMTLVRSICAGLTQAHLLYGGGIDGADKARQAAAAAHTIVVGNVVYDDLEAALATVPAVRDTPAPG